MLSFSSNFEANASELLENLEDNKEWIVTT